MTRAVINDFLLLYQKLRANVTIIKLDLVLERKNVAIIWLYWRYRKIKIQTTLSKKPIRHESHFLNFIFQKNAATHWQIFKPVYHPRSPEILRHISNYLHMYIHFLSTKSIIMSVRHDLMNFTKIVRYKANTDGRSHFCYFVGNI